MVNDPFAAALYIALALVWYAGLTRISRLFVKPGKPAVRKHRGFVPVAAIFADGKTDDFPGFQALFGNAPVIVGNKEYAPGETVSIRGKTFALRTPGMLVTNLDGVEVFRSVAEPRTLVLMADDCRGIEVHDCSWRFGFEYNHDKETD